MSRVRAYLELMRASNLPTVWSNVLMGVVVGGYPLWAGIDIGFTGRPYSAAEQLGRQLAIAWPLIIAMSFFYVGGMVLNDAVDAEEDAKGDAGRPIPSGRVARLTAYVLATVFFALGLSIVAWRYWFGVVAASVVLLALIVAYDALHHRRPRTRLLMGACRGMVVVVGAVAAVGPVAVGNVAIMCLAAVLMMVYTWLISAAAARESLHGDSRRRLVMRMIAAMPLLDAAVLLVLGQWPAVAVCAACAVLTVLGHRRVAGT